MFNYRNLFRMPFFALSTIGAAMEAPIFTSGGADAGFGRKHDLQVRAARRPAQVHIYTRQIRRAEDRAQKKRSKQSAV